MTEPGAFKFTPPCYCWARFDGEIDEHQVRRLLGQLAAAIRGQRFFYLTVDMSEFVKDTIAARRCGAEIMRTLPPRAVAVVSTDWSKRVVAKLVLKGCELLAGKQRRQFSGFFTDEESAKAWQSSMAEPLEQAAQAIAAAPRE